MYNYLTFFIQDEDILRLDNSVSIAICGILLLIGINCTNNQNTILVQRVIDGDTILLANGDRVRYLDIDTPETVHPNKPVE